MLYIADFTFTTGTEEDGSVGHFTCLVEADNIEGAEQKLSSLVLAAHAKQDLFQPGTNVYLHDILEVEKLPESGIMAHYTEMDLSGETSANWPLPYPEDFDGSCYSAHGDEEDCGPDHDHEHDHEAEDIEPFIVIPEKA
ncbi:MAG: hypothetical protein C4524_10650 [Candidatus Zixiibacteriota bacterium]|nr:MAG: hypothetical protein C4524_10650 [candidate division Zixibacteria bacterium]